MSKNKKFALLIGINYVGTQAQLSGCHNDVLKMKEVLINNYNYSDKNITMLVDKQGFIQPTASNIIAQLNSLFIITSKQKINEIYIHYSGHGTNIIDRDGDETDGKDECIVPVDYIKSGIITDDIIYLFLSKIKAVEKKIIFVFYSCNSASCTDLSYSFIINDSNQIIKKKLSKRKPINNNNIFVLSGCLDEKLSYDVAEPDGTPCGLLSYNLRKTLEQFDYSCTIEQLLVNIKKGFNGLDQTPVFSVNSNNIGPNTPIFEKSNQISNPNTQNLKLFILEKDNKDKKY